MSVEEVQDSPTGWVNKHIQDYVDSGGARGHRYNGRDSLLITTRGRKSGQLRRTALFYGVDGNRYAVVGSNGGKATHPGWYLNLLADRQLEVQVGADVFPALATTVDGPDEARLWDLMAGIFPLYDKYRDGTDRHIPVVGLERVTD